MIDDDIIAALNYRLIYGHFQPQDQQKHITGSNYQMRQNTGLVQGSEFHVGDSSGSSMQGMQGTGMVGRFPQNSVNGSVVYPRQMMGQGQTRQQMPQRAPVPAPDAGQFNFQPPLKASTRQNTVLGQGSEFQSRNSSKPPMQRTQPTGMVPCFSQDTVNESMVCTQRLMRQDQTRQQMPQQTSRASAQGQSQQTTSYINSQAQLYGFARNEEASMTEISLSHQQWIEQMHTISPNFPSYPVRHLRQKQAPLHHELVSPSQSPQASMPMNEKASMTQSPLSQQQRIEQMHTISPNSPSYGIQHQRKQQIPLQHRLASPSQSAQASMPLNPRQQSHIVEQCQSAVQPQEQSPRTPVPSGQNSLGFMGSQSGTDASNQLLGKRKIQDLVSQVDKHGKLDPEVEDLLLEFADDFIDSVTAFSCRLAKHRKSSTLEPKDVLLHLDKNWGMKIPGYSYQHTRQDRVNPGGCNRLFRPSLDMVFLTNTSQKQQQTARMQ